MAKEIKDSNAINMEASFLRFLSGLATQTLIQLGEIEHPATKEKQLDLSLAKYSIDLISILQEKTAGNLDEEEQEYFQAMLHDLQMRFINKSGDKK